MLNLTYDTAEGGEGMMIAGLALGYSREYEYNTSNIPLLEQVAAVGGGEIVAATANPFVHNLVATPSVTPIWHFLVMLAACLLPIDVLVRRVVVPVYAVWILLAKGLRHVPGLTKLVPAPSLRPAPVTGTYSGAAAVERRFRSTGEQPSFGIEVRQPVAGPAGVAGEPVAGETAKPAQAGHSEYTAQLLAAKQRAIAKKGRRIESDKDKENP